MKKEAKKPGKKPSVDWEQLFQEWAVSGKPRPEWLTSKGYKHQSGYVYRKTKDWDQRLRALAAGIPKTEIANQDGERVEAVPTYTPDPESLKEAPLGREAKDVLPTAQPTTWQQVMHWRGKQVLSDYKDAESVRTVCKVILKNSLKKIIKEDGTTIVESTLKPHEIRQLMQTLSECQRVQRLSLGLSTENVGIDNPMAQQGSHIEKPQPEEQPVPEFVVVMSGSGKFMRPRPKRIN